MGKQKSAANGRREKEKWKRHNKTNISVKEAAKNRDRLGYLSTSDRLCPHEENMAMLKAQREAKRDRGCDYQQQALDQMWTAQLWPEMDELGVHMAAIDQLISTLTGTAIGTGAGTEAEDPGAGAEEGIGLDAAADEEAPRKAVLPNGMVVVLPDDVGGVHREGSKTVTAGALKNRFGIVNRPGN